MTFRCFLLGIWTGKQYNSILSQAVGAFLKKAKKFLKYYLKIYLPSIIRRNDLPGRHFTFSARTLKFNIIFDPTKNKIRCLASLIVQKNLSNEQRTTEANVPRLSKVTSVYSFFSSSLIYSYVSSVASNWSRTYSKAML